MGSDDAPEPIECVRGRYGIGVDEEQVSAGGDLSEMVSGGGRAESCLPYQMERDADVCQLIGRNGSPTPIITHQNFAIGQTLTPEPGEALPEVFDIVANWDANRKQYHAYPLPHQCQTIWRRSFG